MTAPTGPGPGPASRTGATSARGIALLVGAVVIGIALLRATDPPDSLADASEGPERTATTAAPPTTEDEPDEESTTSSSSSSSTTEPAEDEALVLVANAANEAGVAGRLSVVVEDGGFAIAPPANATVDPPTSTVYFAPGFEEAAADVADLFDPRPTTAPMPDPPPVAAGDLAGATVIVVAAPDIAG